MRVLAALVVLLGLTACSTSSGGSSADSIAGFTSGDGTVTIVAPEKRAQAPVLSGPTLEGEQVSTEDFAGKVIVVNVWGSWCAPCRAEAPELVKAHEALGDQVVFLGVNTRDLEQGPALAFERSFGIKYPSIFDPDGKLLLGFGQLPPKAIPSTLVIDEEGRVAARVLGAVDANTLGGIVDDISADA